MALMPQGTIPRGRGVLRPGAEGPLGRGPPGRDERRAGDPDRAVGHREGVAPQRQDPEPVERHRPADGVVTVGPPVPLGLDDPDVDTDHLMSAIVDLLPPEAREWHEPTDEELAATMPSNAKDAAKAAADHETPAAPARD